MEKVRVPARELQPGDVVGSSETVTSVQVGVRTPRGKVEVFLKKGERQRRALWGASTMINATRGNPASANE